MSPPRPAMPLPWPPWRPSGWTRAPDHCCSRSAPAMGWTSPPPCGPRASACCAVLPMPRRRPPRCPAPLLRRWARARSLPCCSSRRARRAVPSPCSATAGWVPPPSRWRRWRSAPGWPRPRSGRWPRCPGARFGSPNAPTRTRFCNCSAPGRRTMSDTPDPATAAAAPPPPRNSPIAPPGPRRLDPAVVLIGLGGVVLLLALWWLVVTPRSTASGEVAPVRFARAEERLDALRNDVGNLNGRVQQLMALEARTKALEDRPPPPDIRPLEAQVTGLVERVAAAERGAAQAADRAGANERRLQALESRPAVDPATLATKEALEGLSTRLTERLEAQV